MLEHSVDRFDELKAQRVANRRRQLFQVFAVERYP
jgi:hypothetical protein